MASDPYKYYRVEARELLQGLGDGLLELERGPVAPGLLPRLLRLAHTLKGASRVVKQTAVADMAHKLEDALSAHRDATSPLSGQPVNEMLGLLDAISKKVDALGPSPGDPVRTSRKAPSE